MSQRIPMNLETVLKKIKEGDTEILVSTLEVMMSGDMEMTARLDRLAQAIEEFANNYKIFNERLLSIESALENLRKGEGVVAITEKNVK